MKFKFSYTIAIFTLMLFIMQGNVLAAEDKRTEEGLRYTIDEITNEITITGYDGINTDVVIPDFIEGLPVTIINNRAFYKSDIDGKSSVIITSIKLPCNLKVIKRRAFEYSEIEEIDIPDGCTDIMINAFASCNKLKKIVIPQSVVNLEYTDEFNSIFSFVNKKLFKAYVAPESAADKYFIMHEKSLKYYYQDQYIPNKISFTDSEITVNVDEQIPVPKLNIEPANSLELCKGSIEYSVNDSVIKDPTSIKYSKEGEVILTATIKGEHIENSISASLKINVVENRKLVEKVELYSNNKLLEDELTVNSGETIIIEPKVTPKDAAAYTSSWFVSAVPSSCVNYREEDGKMVITAKGSGYADVSIDVRNTFGGNSNKEVKVRLWIKEQKPDEKYVRFSKSDIYMKENETLQLSVETNSDSRVKFESLDPAEASVDSRGMVKAIQSGPKGGATIEARIDEGAVAYCNVWITDVDRYIRLNRSQVRINSDETFRLTADTNSKSNVYYESSDLSVAIVDDNGLVRAAGVGKAAITASISEGKRAVCYVEVADGSYIKLKKQNETMYRGQALKLSLDYKSASEIEYKSSDSKVVTIDEKGNLKAKGTGKAVITASIKEGKKAYCKITVKENRVKLNESRFNMQKGKTVSELTVKSKSIKDDKIKSVKSSNGKILKAQYSKGKIVLKAVKPNSKYVTVTVTMKSGAKASCKVKVVKNTVRTSKLTLSNKNLTLKKGQNETLKVSRNPIGASDKIFWKSSDKKVAAVNSKGKITAKKKGSCTITVRSASGKTAKCKVTVK